MPSSETVVISLHPEHANKILSGNKKLEFRRVWATKPVKAVVIYATQPVQKIVAIGYVKQTHYGSPHKLWNIAKLIGGGLSRRSLYKYFEGKKSGYAIEFERIVKLKRPVHPESVFNSFHPPQSFTYLKESESENLEALVADQADLPGKVIFVSGVHGVGKTSMCEVYKTNEMFTFQSAGQLIRAARSQSNIDQSKDVKNIDDNQKLLINAVSNIKNSGKFLLLDGHFAVWDSEHQPTAIDTKVFIELGIDSIITIHDEPQLIAERINTRDEKSSLSADEIDALQKLEIEQASQIARKLNVPLTFLKAFEIKSFENVVNSYSSN